MARTGAENRLHIGIYGRMNVGKSTLINRLTGQHNSIVSPQAGTTTDPVRRAYEASDLGAVVWIDTAGIDDGMEMSALGDTSLSAARVASTIATLDEVDAAVILLVGSVPDSVEGAFIGQITDLDIPYVVLPARASDLSTEQILERLREVIPDTAGEVAPFFGDKLHRGQTVVMVCPIDDSAPVGRLILPQVQALRAALDLHARAVVVQLDELGAALDVYMPELVVTDSQIFREVTAILAARSSSVALSSFSILLSEQKGDAQLYAKGIEALASLGDGDRVLIIENCSHQISCDDIGRSKIPLWLDDYLASELRYTFVSGRDPLPSDLRQYSLAVQCGGCVATRGRVQGRIRAAQRAGVPITNYGMLIRKIRVK